MSKRGTWRQQLSKLERNVGHGPLAGQYAVNQIYAADQHNTTWYNHPRGGGPDYVGAPLRARYDYWFRNIAAGLLDGSAERRMGEAMDDLDTLVRILAPLDENDLRRSGSYFVTSGGAVVIQRAADQPRLTEAELAEKRKRRAARGR